MRVTRSLFVAAALALLPAQAGYAQSVSASAQPTLRAEITVSGDVVKIGDLVENAGPSATIAIYRAPDPGTSGALAVPALLAALRAHDVIGIDTRGLRDIKVTRNGRTVPTSDIETAVAQALAQRLGVADPSALTVTFDREVQALQLDLAYADAPKPIALRIDPRGRFDLTFEIAGDGNVAPMRLRYTGSATETIEAVIAVRSLERGESLKASDISVERRPRVDASADAVARERAIGMQVKRQVRAGAALRAADLAKPDLVQRDQSIMLIYEAVGLYLTGNGKALEGGAEGDVVTVMNLSSKRTVTGTVTGRGQVTVAALAPRPAPAQLSAAEPANAVALAAAVLPIQHQAE